MATRSRIPRKSLSRNPHSIVLLCIAFSAAAPGCSAVKGWFDSDSDATISGLTQAQIENLPEDPATPDSQESPRGGSLSIRELEERNRVFADRYRVVLAGAVDEIMRRRDDPLMRKKAHQLKLDGATAIYDIVVDPSPQSALLNLVVQITLQKKLADATAKAEFPDDHPLVEDAVEQLYDEIWSHAALVLQERERRELLAIIDRWWDDHGGERAIWYARLSDLSGYGTGTSLAGVIGSARGLPSQVLNTLVPLSDANESLDEFTNISESATWYAPRLVILSQWRLEALIFESLATTEITQAIDAVQRFTETAETLPEDVRDAAAGTIEQLAEHESTLTPMLEQTDSILNSAGRTADEATELAKAIGGASASLEALGKTVDPIIARFTEDDAGQDSTSASDESAGRPFDITEYTEAVRALDETLEQTEDTVMRLEDVTEPERLEARLDAVTGAAGRVVLYATLGLIVAAAAIVAAIVAGVLAVRRWSPDRRGPRSASPPDVRYVRA